MNSPPPFLFIIIIIIIVEIETQSVTYILIFLKPGKTNNFHFFLYALYLLKYYDTSLSIWSKDIERLSPSCLDQYCSKFIRLWDGGVLVCLPFYFFQVMSLKSYRTWTDEIYIICRKHVVRDSSAVRRLFVRLAGAVGRQSALLKENSGFAAPTPGRHISTFCGYQILFSIRNPYINCFTNNFSTHS